MIGIYLTLVVLALLAIYFAFEGANTGRSLQIAERENEEMRGRVSELVGEVRRLRDASGLPSQVGLQTPDDELMPLRQTGRLGARAKQNRAAPDSPGTVVLVSGDAAEIGKLNAALSASGYHVVSAALSDATRYAHEMTTAAFVFDLRDTATATGAETLLAAFASDPLAREVPVFALVASSVERERLIDDASYTGAFTVPTDPAIVSSSLGAAIIRRKTRARRQEAGRILAAPR